MAAKNAETLIFIRKNMLSKLKGIVNPKLKILSSFNHPQVVPNLYEFIFFCRTQRKIF